MHDDPQAISQMFYEAVHYVMHGDANPMLALWSESTKVTYCDPYGRFHQGRDALVAYWQRAALLNRQVPGSVSVIAELLMIQSSREMLCTVMLEHIQVREQDRVLCQQALATNIYRHEEQGWHMVHRHAGTPTEENS